MKSNSFNLAALTLLIFLSLGGAARAQVGQLRVLIHGRELPPTVQAERRGANVLAPVVPVARQLGYQISVDRAAETIRVRRAGIEAEFAGQVGEVRENGVTIAAVPFAADTIFSPNEETLLLPLEVIAPLLNVSAVVDNEKNAVLIESHDATAADVTSQQRSRFEVGGLNYTYNSSFLNGFFYQNLNLNSTGRVGDSIYQSSLNLLGGGNYRFINFYSGNFTLQQPNGNQFQVGDLTNTVGTELSLMNTLVRGASFARPLFGDRGKFVVYGGRAPSGVIEDLFERRSPSLSFDTTVVGSRFGFQPEKLAANRVSVKNLYFSTGALWYRGDKNRGLLVDGTARYSTSRLNVEAEISAGSFDLETQDRRDIEGFGTGLIVSASYAPFSFLRAQGRFERFSPNFSNPTRTNQYNNREVKSLGVSVQPFRNLSFGANATFTDNRSQYNFRTASFSEVQTEAYAANFAYDPQIKFLPRVSVIATKYDNELFGSFTIVNANLAREFKNLRPYVNYIFTESNGSAGHGVNVGSGIDAGKLGQFQAQYGFSLSPSATISEEELRCQLQITTCSSVFRRRFEVSNSTASLDWQPADLLFDRLQFSVGSGYVKDSAGTSLLFRTSGGVRLGFDQSIQVSYYRSQANSELRFTVSGPLTFWKSKNRVNSEVTDSALLTDGTIRGRVYTDANGNRQFDAGVDAPMTGTRVRLNNGYEVVSDANGNYAFERIPPGEYHVALNLEDVRANLVPANGLEQTLIVLPRMIVDTSFRLVQSGAASGRVWHDKNENGKYDEGEGLADVRLLSSSGRDTYSDPDGSFLITDLPPGEQSIFVDERYQPEDLTISNSRLRAEVRSAEKAKDIEFVFKTKPREVKEIDFGTNRVFTNSPPR